jgi:predicted alpha/beta superfamily hydrolase
MYSKFVKGLAAPALLIVGLASPAISLAQTERAPGTRLEIGVSHRIRSKALGEQRTINVVLPASYGANPSRRFPVLYLLDGGLEQDLLHVAGLVRLGAIWGRSAEAIVVGIETKDRRRELAGPTTDPELRKRYPTAGSSAKFREFIRLELKPLIEKSYRTDHRDSVLGESLAGLFIVETYLAEPALFDRYGAVDPSLWWDKEALSRAASKRAGRGQHNHPILIAVAKEQAEDAGAYQRLLASLQTAKLNPCLLQRADQTHATIYQQVAPMVLQHLLPPEEPAPAEYGFTSACPSGS